ncbi:MAG: hypothetical protein ABIJ96_02605 [Elusimicrobiota bacterium]
MATEGAGSALKFAIGITVGALAVWALLPARPKPPPAAPAPQLGVPERAVSTAQALPVKDSDLPPLTPLEERPWLRYQRVPPKYDKTALALVAAVRKYEGRFERLGRKYSARYPVIREYGREWMQHDDLRRLQGNYHQDRDPVKFALGASASPNFYRLVTKYSTQPEFQAFVRDSLRIAPRDLHLAVRGYLRQDKRAEQSFMRYAKAAGIPAETAALATASR